MSNIGSDVQSLDSELRTRTDSFKHLLRLKDFVTAYASTIVEVVRRREFARHLLDYASALANSLSKLTAEERKRRVTYRADYGGKMPFAVEGLDDVNVPTIEFEIRNVTVGGLGGAKPKDPSRSIHAPGDLPQLTRADVDDLIVSLRNIEESSEDERDSEKVLARGLAREVKGLIEKQFSRLESMENAFAQAVERIVVTESQLVTPIPVIDQEMVTHLQSQVEELKNLNDRLREENEDEKITSEKSTRKFQSDIKLHLQKIEDLKLQLTQLTEESTDERNRLSNEYQSCTQERDSLLKEVSNLRSEVCRFEEDLKVRNKALQDVERQLASARATADDATKDLHDLEARHRDQLSDHSVALNQLQQYRERSADLEIQLRRVLNENKEKDELLEQTQSEAERVKKEMQAKIDELTNELEEQKNLNRDANVKIDQQESKIDDFEKLVGKIEKTNLESEQRIERLERYCRTAVEMVQTYQITSQTITHRIDTMPKPGSSRKTSAIAASSAALNQSMTMTATTTTTQQDDKSSSIVPVLEPLSSTSYRNEIPKDVLSLEFDRFFEELSKFNHEKVVELVQNQLEILSSTVRKWMKDSQIYRQRASRAQELAHFRITFRHFAKGDLCLFLPTRNPMAKVWAAFHVSFPHYFLQANEVVAPIINSREWLLARIISLTEQIVDPKEPDTNPFALPAGTRYFLLEVEPWSVDKSPRKQPAQSAMGLGQPSPVKKHAFSRSATLPSQMDLQMTSSAVTKRHSTGEESNIINEQTHNSLPLQSSSANPNSCVMDSNVAVPSGASHSQPPTQAGSDLTQSEFTVIDRPPSPGATSDVGGDSPFGSPFRTSPGSPSSRTRIGPSALALSLAKSYQRSPLSHGSVSAQPDLVTLPEVGGLGSDLSQVPNEFRPSESARPAFLASMSSVISSSSQSRRTNLSSTMMPPVKPRTRPVPKAYTASRSTSRTPSIASSSNLVNPAMKKLLRPGSPSSKGLSTVSTSLVSSEKTQASSPSDSQKVEQQRTSTPSPVVVGPRSILKSNELLIKRRVSVSGSTTHPVMVYGTSGSSNSSNLGSSGHLIQNPGGNRLDGSQLSRSPSLNTNNVGATVIGIPASSSSSSNNNNNSGTITGGAGTTPSNNNNSGGGLSGSLFGTWRKRKESLVVLPSSFSGASDLLKRFSSQNPPPPSPKS